MIWIFILQVGLIFSLSERQPVKARLPHPSPSIHLANATSADLLMLTDPTLFALPHRNGFSGKAWLKPPRFPALSLDWSEPTNWLPLAIHELGGVFNQFSKTNIFTTWSILSLPEPAFKLAPAFVTSAAAEQSVMRIEGGLAQRRLLNSVALRAWPRADLLTNSIVQLVVDSDGRQVSVPVLLTSSTDREADDFALEQARAARFEPLPSNPSSKLPLAGLTWGRLIFQWAIVPPSTTNAAPSP